MPWPCTIIHEFFDPLKRLRVDFSFFWVGEHVFLPFTVCKSGEFRLRIQAELGGRAGKGSKGGLGALKGGLKERSKGT